MFKIHTLSHFKRDSLYREVEIKRCLAQAPFKKATLKEAPMRADQGMAYAMSFKGV